MLRTRLVPFALVLTLLTNAASAAGVVMYSKHERPDPRDVASILSRSPQVPAGLKMRSIKMLPAAGEEEKLPELPRSEAGPLDYAAAGAAVPMPELAAVVAGTPRQTAKPEPSADDNPTSLALPVQFAFDSARILAGAYGQVDAVVAGIKLAGPKVKVVIEGHTDSVGSTEYNLRLSSQRAEAVRTYLITAHGIEPSRLRVVGMGKFSPLNKAVPSASENRRVEFRAEA